MKKILDLLEKAGCKSELTAAIGEALDQYKSTIREQFEADYTAKVEQAKKVCIDETEAHKRELSRRVQVFLETKGAAIDAHLQRQSALNESEAVTKLKNVRALVEGITLEQNGAGQNGQLPAVIEKAKQKIQQLTEERDQAVALANKKGAIAEKVLQRNRVLVSENAKLKVNGGTKPAVTEGRGAPRGTPRIDTSRAAARPVTSRPTIVESQDRRPTVQVPAGQTNPQGGKGVSVTDIAANMDEDLI